MVAAFRDDPRHPQLPLQAWTQHPNQGSSSPSFDYADPVVQKPSVQINPRIRPSLARGAIAPPKRDFPYPRSRPLSLPQTPYRSGQSAHAALSTMAAPSMALQSTASPSAQKTSAVSPSVVIRPTRVQQAVMAMPKPAPYAPWVQWLMVGQKGICLLTLTLVGSALALYGQSVYQHRQWGQSYAQLERLQKLEQQGIAASEIMKQSLAEEAERPTSQMTSQMPDKAISLEMAPARSFDDADMPTKSVLDLDLDGPMGY